MKPFDPGSVKGPERIIQEAIENLLRIRGWFVLRTHGNAFQVGLPDDFACHKLFGHKWVEVKLPGMKGSKYTPAQLKVFPQLCKNRSGVWVLTAATDEEYNKLFQPPNWHKYLPEYGGIFK